jgi:hypothetical protein
MPKLRSVAIVALLLACEREQHSGRVAPLVARELASTTAPVSQPRSPAGDSGPESSSAFPMERGSPAADAELRSLEEEARRRIDLSPLLEAAGVDARALAKRPDADEVLRQVAGDELLVRAALRDLFATTTYPYGYPRDVLMREARSYAERITAGLSPQERSEALARELERPDADLPEPTFEDATSGRVFGARPDAADGGS